MSSTKRFGVFFSRKTGEGRPCGQVAAQGQSTHSGRVGVQSVRATRRLPLLGFALGMGSALSLAPASALAQDAVPPPPPAATPPAPMPPPPADTTAAPMPMPPPPPPGAVPPAQAATPPIASEAMPATREEKLPPIDVGAWVRTGMRFQGTNPRNLDGVSTDGSFPIYGELHAGGKIHKMISLTLNVNAGGAGGPLAIEDAIIGFDPMPEFHIWLGQMLVPVDRPNYGGPFFAIPWNFYPGVFVVGGKGFDSSLSGAVVVTPKEGPTGRNVGAAVWGDVGAFQYALGAFLPSDANSGTLFSGRLAVNFLDHESGYFGNASYFGDKNIAAISLGGQYQHDAVTQSVDYFELSADGLLELKYGDGGGYVTGEIGYNKFTDHSNEAQVGTLPYNTTDTVFALAAIATPKMGPGQLQPNFRYQLGAGDAATPKVWSVDAGVNYLLMGPAMRLFAVYQHVELGQSIYGNQVQLGAQAIFF